METHENAPLTPRGREMMVRAVMDEGLSKAAAARRFNTTPKTVAKRVERFEGESVEGLRDRSSRPHSSPSQTAPAPCARGEALRRRRRAGHEIAAEVGVSAATVSRILKRLGLNRLAALEPAEPIRRYERQRPGAILHIDNQKAWQVQSRRPPDHRRPRRPEQRPGSGLGIPASGDRRPCAPRLFRNPARRKTRLLPALSLQRPALVSQPRRQD